MRGIISSWRFNMLEVPDLVGMAREQELSCFSDHELQLAIGRVGIPVPKLAGGLRYSRIQAVLEWEKTSGKRIWELTKKVEQLKSRDEVKALRALVELKLAEGRLPEQILSLVDEFMVPSTWALMNILLSEGYLQQEIDAAIVTCRR